MPRARRWTALAVGAVLVLPAAGAAGDAPLGGRVASALPVVEDRAPRLALTDELTTTLVEVPVTHPVRSAFLTGGTTPPTAVVPGTPPVTEWSGQAHVADVWDLGRTWVFVTNRDEVPDRHAAGDVYAATAVDGGWDVRRLTCDDARESHPVVHPDGTVAYATDVDGDWDLALTTLGPDDACEDPPPPPLHAPGDDLWPAWLPQSRLLAFSSTRADPLADLFLLDADAPTAEPARLTSSPEAETQPAVSGLDSAGDGSVASLVYVRSAADEPAGTLNIIDLRDTVRGKDPFSPDAFSAPYKVWGGWQASEPAFGPDVTTTDDEVPPDARVLAWTSTRYDAAGDVVATIATRLPEQEGRLDLGDDVRVAGEPGRAESHPAWSSGFSEVDDGREQTWLTVQVADGDADLVDVRADDGGDGRVLASSVYPPPDDSSAGPRPDALGDVGPAYSPTGDRLVHSAQRQVVPGSEDLRTAWALRLHDARSGAELPLDYPREPDDVDLDAAWSPDGGRVAFVRHRLVAPTATTREATLQVLDLRATPPTLTQVPLPGDRWRGQVGLRDPSWSPDGTRIVVSRSFESFGIGLAAAVPDDEGDESELWVADVVAGTAAPLATVVPPSECVPGEPCEPLRLAVQGRSPAWSPDGREIAAASLGVWLPELSDVRWFQRAQVGVVTLESPASTAITAVRALTGFAQDGSPTPTRAVLAAADDPAWSPDGREIALTGVRAGRERDTSVWVLAADGSTARPLVDTPVLEREPVFQPWTDLVLTLAASVGGDGTGTVTAAVANAGPGPVDDATVTLALPAGASASGTPGCTVAGAEVTCTVPGRLAAGGRADVVVPVSGAGGLADPTVRGVATSTTPERVVANNSATVDLAAAGSVGVQVVLSAPVAWVGGRRVDATVTVRNAGTSPATDVRLTTGYPGTVVPSGLAPCAAPAGTCDLGTLPGGASVVLTVTLDPSVVVEGPPQTDLVTAAVTTATPDVQPADDTASAPLEVRRPVLTLSSGVTRPGEVTFAVGDLLPPGEQVVLAWSTGIMSAPGPHVVAADGRLRVTLPVVADTLLGPRTLTASSPAVPPTFAPVTTSLLVVPRSAQAPSFLFRD